MRLWRIRGKGRTGTWVFAATEERARQLFFEGGMCRKPENITRCVDQTAFFSPGGESPTDVLEVDVEGFGALAIPQRKWIVGYKGKRLRTPEGVEGML